MSKIDAAKGLSSFFSKEESADAAHIHKEQDTRVESAASLAG
jgi:hypothetical protein